MIRYRVLFAALLSLSLSARAQQPGPAGQPASVAVAAAPIPTVPTALQRCDKSMGDATTMAQKMEVCAKQLKADHSGMAAEAVKPNNSVPRGLPDTRFSSLPEDMSSPANRNLLFVAAPSALRMVLVEYFTYVAYAAGDPAACKRLAVVDLDSACRENVASLNEMHAVMGEPWELVKACRQPENKLQPPACCAALAKIKDRSNACALMVPACFKEQGACRAFWGRADGDAKACALLPLVENDGCKTDGCDKERAQNVARCEGDAAFARAFKAKDVAVCGGSQRCRVLMGQGKEVAAEIAAKKLQNPGGDWFIKGGWKTPPPPPAPEAGTAPTVARHQNLDYLGFTCMEPLQSSDNRKVAANVITVAKTCLSDIETAVGTPSRALSEGMDEREEKLARLTVRMELALAETAPPVKKPAPARAPR